MIRVCGVSVVLLASLTAATACFAAEPGAASAAGPGGGPGRGAIGGQLGISSFRLDRALGSDWFGDYSDGSALRLNFHAHWRYRVNNWLRWQIGTGFAWSGYSESALMPFPDPNFPDETSKGEVLTLFVPVTAELHYVMQRGWYTYYAGGGPGVYRVWVENHRKVLKDPVSLKLHRGVYPGGSFEMGVQRYLKGSPNVSLEAAIGGHLALAQRHDQFPSGFDSNVMALELRFGANYSFTPGVKRTPTATTPKTP